MRSGEDRAGWLARFWQRIAARIWYVHPPIILIIKTTPARCVHSLATATRPRTQRLDLSSLYIEGRRYQLHPHRGGFALTTTSKILWRYRRRTSSAAVLKANLSEIDGETTRIRLHANIKLLYLLDVFLIPAFMTSIVLFIPWPPLVIGVALGALYLLSWFGHRLNAMLEANEMIFFVQKVLEDFVPAEALSLSAGTAGVIYDRRDFDEAWEKFYREHLDEEP